MDWRRLQGHAEPLARGFSAPRTAENHSPQERQVHTQIKCKTQGGLLGGEGNSPIGRMVSTSQDAQIVRVVRIPHLEAKAGDGVQNLLPAQNQPRDGLIRVS